jgi:hypothetical protein
MMLLVAPGAPCLVVLSHSMWLAVQCHFVRSRPLPTAPKSSQPRSTALYSVVLLPHARMSCRL